MNWIHGSLFTRLYDGERLLGLVTKFNCCTWLTYDHSGLSGADPRYGEQLPGQYASEETAKAALEKHFAKDLTR